jgi:thymidylate kinase
VVKPPGDRPHARIDVIAELSAHQQNLVPAPMTPRAALVVLPLAPIARFIAGDWFEARRARALSRLAEELGGGDGPLPIVMAAAGAPLPEQLAELWRTGVRALFVHGMADRPGHARALAYRWPGALHPIGDRDGAPSALDLLFEGDRSITWLEPDVVRVAPGVAAPAARLVFAATGEDDPRRVREQGEHVWPYALDRRRRLGCWSGVLPAAGAFGSEEGARVRERWGAHWSELGRPDAVRLAALGLEPALEADLAAREPAPQPERRARVIAITGLDGSGKSSHAARLARSLRDRGARVQVLKLYRQGAFLELANELGARTRRGAPLAAFRTSRAVKLVDSLRLMRDHMQLALAECDALVMDRYDETHLAAAASQLGWDLSAHPMLAPFPPADVRFWLELDAEAALRRRDARGERPSADEHLVGLRGYAQEFARLAAGPREVRLDAAATVEENAAAIADRALPLVTPRGPAERSLLTPPGAAPARERTARCAIHLGAAPAHEREARGAVHLGPAHERETRGAVHLGPAPAHERAARGAVHLGAADPDLPELGADVIALRAALERWCGDAARGVPEAFWLETYAAQILLDLRTGAPARARVALWPGALARMEHHGDLEMLRELERMLLAEVDVIDYRDSAPADSFAALGAHPSAAPRLARAYAAALAALADERGWPARP